MRDSGGFSGAVAVTNSTSLSLAGSAYSFEAWIKPHPVPPTANSNWRTVLYKAVFGGSMDYGLYLFGAPASKLCFTTILNNVGYCVISNFRDDTWAHVAMTCDTTGIWRLYVNGTQLGSQSGHTANLDSTSADLVLGFGAYMDLDTVQIWARVRAPSEICADASKTWSGTACQ